jgi:tetratricopeptide (TPR) repeat protein
VRVRGSRDETAAIERALANARAAVEEEASPEALDARGRALLAAGQADAASADFERALAEEPENGSIAADAAAAAIERGAYDDAIARLDALLAREPAREDALFNRALALQRARRDDDARRAWRRYLEVDSTSKWADEARAYLDDLAE